MNVHPYYLHLIVLPPGTCILSLLPASSVTIRKFHHIRLLGGSQQENTGLSSKGEN